MKRIEWVKKLGALRPQMTPLIGADWMQLTLSLASMGRYVSPEEAAAWDAAGYPPMAARSRILAGMTPEESS